MHVGTVDEKRKPAHTETVGSISGYLIVHKHVGQVLRLIGPFYTATVDALIPLEERPCALDPTAIV